MHILSALVLILLSLLEISCLSVLLLYYAAGTKLRYKPLWISAGIITMAGLCVLPRILF